MAMSEEEDNFIRIFKLLSGVAPKAVRAFFDREFPPMSLPSTLTQKSIKDKLRSLQQKRVINQTQWDLLYPSLSGVPDSKTFDVTLMICLIRNLTFVTPPTLGFECIPSTGDTTPGADLARIKYYRNYLAHLNDNQIDNSDFTTAWNNISYAIVRLGGCNFQSLCDDIKFAFLSHDIHSEVRQEMSLFRMEYQEIRCEHEQIKLDHQQIKLELEQIKSGFLNDRSQPQTSSENPELMQVSSIDRNNYPMVSNQSLNPVVITADSVSSTSNSASASVSSIFSGTFINSSISVQNLHVHYGNNNVSQQMPEN